MSLSTYSYLDNLNKLLEKTEAEKSLERDHAGTHKSAPPEKLPSLHPISEQELAYQIFISIDHQWRTTPLSTHRGILYPTLLQKYQETSITAPGEPPEKLLNQLLFCISNLIVRTSSLLHIRGFLAELDTESLRLRTSTETIFQIYFEQYNGLKKLKNSSTLTPQEEDLCKRLLLWFKEVGKKRPAFAEFLVKKSIETLDEAMPISAYNTGRYDNPSDAASSFRVLITPKTRESVGKEEGAKVIHPKESLSSLCFAKKFEHLSGNEPEELLKLMNEEKDPGYALRHFARFKDQKHFERYINSRTIQQIEIYIEIFRLIPIDARLIRSSRGTSSMIDLNQAMPLIKEKLDQFYADAYAKHCQQSP